MTLANTKMSTPEDRAQWEAVKDEEYELLAYLDTWEPKTIPQSQPLPAHLVHKVKKSSWLVDWFMRGMSAGGILEMFGKNYAETYVPVLLFALVCIFLYIEPLMNMYRAQVDVKIAFPNELP